MCTEVVVTVAASKGIVVLCAQTLMVAVALAAADLVAGD